MNRHLHIDFLRAISIIGMITIHVLVFNITSDLTRAIWNYLHFVVAAFIFCSGYVLLKYQTSLNTFAQTIAWYKKRAPRLLIPYYAYFFIHFGLALFFPTFFSGIGIKTNYEYFLRGLVLFSDSALSWLPLLFTELMLLLPLLFYLNRKRLLKYYILLPLIIASLIPLRIIDIDYRLIMWLPWSILTVIAFYFSHKEKTKIFILRYLAFGSTAGIIFLISFFIWKKFNLSTSLFDNEYPPNIFHLSYGIVLTMFTLALTNIKITENKLVKPIYSFFSLNSYTLFFVHYVILDLVITTRSITGNRGLGFELISVFTGSIIIILVYKKAKTALTF